MELGVPLLPMGLRPPPLVSPSPCACAQPWLLLLPIRCSVSTAKSLLLRFLPFLRWLPRYPVKDWLLGDIASGFSVGIMHLPQGERCHGQAAGDSLQRGEARAQPSMTCDIVSLLHHVQGLPTRCWLDCRLSPVSILPFTPSSSTSSLEHPGTTPWVS